MTMTNATKYQTADLRAIVSKVATDELADHPARRKRLTVEVVYTRGAGADMSGIAWRGACLVRLRVPRTDANPVLFAWLAAHEIAHVRGMKHRSMPDYLNNFTATSRVRWAWAADYPIRQAPRPVKSALADALAARDHVLTLLRLADTRLKRAKTIRAKWTRRAAVAERRLAAAYDKEPLHANGDLDLAPAAGRGTE